MSATYTELHARSAYSFLRGASLPEHLVDGAVADQFMAKVKSVLEAGQFTL